MKLHFGTAQGSLFLATAMAGLLAGVGLLGTAAQAQPAQAAAALYNQAGQPVGTVTFTEQSGKVMVRVDVMNLPPGFHGFHVHTSGVCDASASFTTAGGHLNLDTGNGAGVGDMMGMGTTGSMAGEMTNLHVTADGTGSMSFLVDRFTIADLLASGGRSIMVHAGADNFRNIPERYGVTLDQATMDTGDAGPRIACGVIQSA